MLNFLCGGAKFLDEYFETSNNSEILFNIIHGTKDEVVPPECSPNMKCPLSKLQTIYDADHSTVNFGRERDFTRDPEESWFPSAKQNQYSVS